MKKFNNILVIIALIFVIIGNLLYWGAKLFRYINREDYNKDIGNIEFRAEGDVNSVNIKVQCADVEITAADSFGCRLENVDVSTSSAYVRDNTFFIDARNKENMNILGWDIGTAVDPGVRSKVYVNMPEDQLYNFRAEIGSGSLDAGTIRTSNLVIQVGAGNIYINTIRTEKNGAVQIGAGKVKIYNLDAKDITIKSGIGDLSVSPVPAAGDYSIGTKTGLGKLNLFSGWRIGILHEFNYYHDSFRNVRLSNGVGNITVR